MRKLQVTNYTLPVFIGILLFTFHCSLFARASAAELDDIVELIQTKYDAIQDLRGKFSQTSYLKDLESVQQYKGEFFIKKPSSMKWIFANPRDEEVIIRGGTLWIYKRSEKQAIKAAFSKEAYSQVPMALLNSLGDLKTDFNITEIKENTLELIPKRRIGFIHKVLLEVNDHDFPIKKFSIFDTHGNQIDVEVQKVKKNSGLEDSFFIFKPQPGIEVFDFDQ
ncbi:MAG: outer membrane lipoprotein chaperone LolA [Thermodesulfovibrionia bacterium]|nr:outer membrane lipoprotein chaperone LolA [Thermodesulfovibrionia bacterium]